MLTITDWFTDLDAARAAATRLGRPILSLRLLGRLDEEQSCANSRFFRTTLYPDPRVAALLRDDFVVHWRSVRPVPRVRVDFGDGRVLERTLTGNSAHLVLDARGRPVDALPGLYGAAAFVRALRPAAALARAAVRLDSPAFTAALASHHRARVAETLAAWAGDLAAVGVRARIRTAAAAEAASTDAAWRAMTELHAGEARLHPATATRLRQQYPDAFRAGALAVTKMAVERPLLSGLLPLERDIAEDTLRNERQLHRRVSERFAAPDGGPPEDDVAFTSWIYEELFLMPDDDPWLGLAAAFAAAPTGASMPA